MIERPPGEASLEGLTREQFLKVAGAAGVVVTASGSVIAVLSDSAGAQTNTGPFGKSALFVEPYIYYPTYTKKGNKNAQTRVRTAKECIDAARGQDRQFCKPAAGSNGLLPDGRFLYWNALEGTEDSKMFGFDADKSIEDSQSRVLTINYGNPKDSKWLKPFQATGGVRDEPESELFPGSIGENRPGNNGDMFCSSQCHLPDGSILVVGGTHWYQESAGSQEADFVELEGLSASRFFDYKKNKWFRTEDMTIGRWYPALVPSADGTPIVFGGVHKLEKPTYDGDTPGEPPAFDSGGNVLQVERLNLDTGAWEILGNSMEPTGEGRRTLPLQPRMQMLPNGHMVYNGVGQAFSPNGQDRSQPLWNIAATFDPTTEAWTEQGPAGQGCLEPNNNGSKLSCFQVPLLMEKNGNGDYDTMKLLTGGGTAGNVVGTNPGAYIANNTSRLSTFVVDGDSVSHTSVDTDPMFSAANSNEIPGVDPTEPSFPVGRWFGDAVLLPDGTVFVSGGADRDEVVFPGAEFPILEVEQFDPEGTPGTGAPVNAVGSWEVVGELPIPRTYHNTNSLLPTGEVIVGGHAPIPFGYVSHDSDQVEGTRNQDGRDPTFQIWRPPYVTDANRPKINVAKNGQDAPLSANTGGNLVVPTSDGADITDVVIQRLPATTHINDTEQRGLVLEVTSSSGTSVTAEMPKTLAELGGPGWYLAFIRNDDGVPSEGVFVKVSS